MNWFEKFIINSVLDRIVRQGPWHEHRITEFYRLVTKAARKEFREDNKVTLDHFLIACHLNSLNK